MKCALCGLEFDEKAGTSACAGCPLAKGCRLIRCPNCGYETPAEPEWLRRLFGKSMPEYEQPRNTRNTRNG